MISFENYERKIDKIQAVLAKYTLNCNCNTSRYMNW